jgi:hypothetical protein
MTLFKGLVRDLWNLLKKRTLILAFLFYWLIFIIGTGAALVTPESGPELVAKFQQRALETQPWLSDAKESGNYLLVFIYIFLMNFLYASIYIGILSLLFFPPLIFEGYQALTWGLMFSPFKYPIRFILPNYLTIFLEGMGYIIALTGTFGFGKAIFSSRNKGKRKEAYIQAIKDSGKLFILVAVVLLIAAAYETFAKCFIYPSLRP